MSLGDRLREMLDPGSSNAAGAGGQPASARRRSRTQAEPVGGNGGRYYDAEPGRPMPRAQWIGLGLAAAVAVALTAGLVFAILTMTRPSSTAATPTPLPVVASPTTASSIAAIFASPTTATAIAPAGSPTPSSGIGQRLQVANTGGEGANMRRSAGQAGERIKVIPDGGIVDVIGPDQSVDGTTWRNVRDLQGDTGWIAASLLAPEGTAPIASAPGAALNPVAPSGPAAPATQAPRPTAAAASSAPAGRAQVGNTGGQGANVRSEPGTGGRILKTLAEGATIEVLGPEREVDGVVWRQVRDSAGVTGWIIRGAVAPAGSVPTPAPAATRAPAGPTSAPAAKPVIVGTPKPSGNPTPKPGSNATPAATAPAQSAPTATSAPKPDGDLPIIIQPATPRPR